MPVKMRIEAPPGLPALLKRLSALEGGEVVSRATGRFAPILIRALVEKSQAKAGSGPFSRSWIVAGGTKGLITKNTVAYAGFVERSTRPHFIRPKRRKALRWRKGGKGPISAFSAPIAGQSKNFFFAKVVFHPGTVGKHIYSQVIRQQAAKLFSIVTEEISKILGTR
jgi:hypothetical protein